MSIQYFISILELVFAHKVLGHDNSLSYLIDRRISTFAEIGRATKPRKPSSIHVSQGGPDPFHFILFCLSSNDKFCQYLPDFVFLIPSNV